MSSLDNRQMLKIASYLEVLSCGLVVHDVGRARLIHDMRDLLAGGTLVNANLEARGGV